MKRDLVRGTAGVIFAGAMITLGVSAKAATGFTLGDAANYVVLFQGGGGNTLNINNPSGLQANTDTGRIGIDNTGILGVSGPLVINGNVDFANSVRVNGQYNNGGNVTIRGTVSGGHANVHSDMVYLNSLSSTLGAETGTRVALNSGSVINGASGALDTSGNRVFTVTGMNAPNGTLTINADTTGTHNIVFNIGSSWNFHFNRIVLGAGLTSDNVLFNFFGGNNSTLSGGPTLDMNSNYGSANPNNRIFGTFLDPNGKISIVSTYFGGRVFGGDSQNEQLVSGATLVQPATVTVPDGGSTLFLLGAALSGVGFLNRRLHVQDPKQG